jgi:hypothetical protein
VPLRRRCNNDDGDSGDAGATLRASLQLADDTDTDGDGGVVKDGDAWCGVDVFAVVDDDSDGNASLSYDCRRWCTAVAARDADTGVGGTRRRVHNCTRIDAVADAIAVGDCVTEDAGAVGVVVGTAGCGVADAVTDGFHDGGSIDIDEQQLVLIALRLFIPFGAPLELVHAYLLSKGGKH